MIPSSFAIGNGSLFIPDNSMLTEHALLSCYQIQVTIQQLSDLFPVDFSSGVRFLLAIVIPPMLCAYYTPH